jgi:signal peptidase I
MQLTAQQRASLAGLIVSLVMAALGVAALLWPTGCSRKEAPKTRIVAPAITTVSFTGSMEPTFVGGDRILISPIAIEAVRERALIVYWEEARELNILHRVVQVRHAANGEIGLVCRGDNNDERDWHIVTRENLIGLATRLP